MTNFQVWRNSRLAIVFPICSQYIQTQLVKHRPCLRNHICQQYGPITLRSGNKMTFWRMLINIAVPIANNNVWLTILTDIQGITGSWQQNDTNTNFFGHKHSCFKLTGRNRKPDNHLFLIALKILDFGLSVIIIKTRGFINLTHLLPWFRSDPLRQHTFHSKQSTLLNLYLILRYDKRQKLILSRIGFCWIL